MAVYGCLLVENNVDEGSRLLLQPVFNLGIKKVCQAKQGWKFFQKNIAYV